MAATTKFDGHMCYVAYMLRLWQSGSRDGQPVWRASLENPHTGERLAFVSPKALFAFLADLTAFRAETGGASEASEPSIVDSGPASDAPEQPTAVGAGLAPARCG